MYSLVEVTNNQPGKSCIIMCYKSQINDELYTHVALVLNARPNVY